MIIHEPVDGMPPNSIDYITGESLRAVYVLLTLTTGGFSLQILVSTISFEPVDGFSSNLHRFISVTS